MSSESSRLDAVFLECMKKLNDETVSWQNARASGNAVAERKAAENISAYLNGAAETLPTFVPDKENAKSFLSTASNVFHRKGNGDEKKVILNRLFAIMRFCGTIKVASALASSGGLVALCCLSEHQSFVMPSGSILEVSQLKNHDGSTTRMWDLNHNGIPDQQDTVNDAGQVIDDAHTMTDWDFWSDIFNMLPF
ncbi:hypothetical protein ASPWEDRAFT_46565 [Aspergillus wentii DTO 134E9]|uniref:Uncharacterized protein n=1 Tax=Aspergillus wentii DTO 134E9 TaxID=1073089 RepID=A0A1L9R4E7_ASPWE|nr:uncharacterized protein ASPWEDRAFT_46565 [Aspergillus wentii DTO 134E9]KAI9927084.1 hypothetical protein MW887_003467 [Aspergillus wentii]OJJ29805.1 hypothetical protein ASPWEDRAFT_46565 [Aspergillus wentii DTO 134E9]